MRAVDAQVIARPVGRLRSLAGFLTARRFWIYLSCTALAVLASYLLGKEMMWDTLDYHFYAGFSALHDRFGRDYFAAGLQSYLNPYIYVPFYALARTSLPALWVASLLAAVQSGILWLTYELAVAVSPSDQPGSRIVAGACAALLALLNPILIDQLGSSYVDIISAEIVLGGWLLLVYALRVPGAARIVCAGLLLGAASALKLTNSLHALSACVLLLFLPASRRGKTLCSLGFFVALAASFAVVAGPWALRLEQHFGNPFLPLLNNVFRSPYFPAVTLADFRFVPSSFAEALLRPLTIALPVTYVDDEAPSPDIRYAVLAALALVAAVTFAWRRFHPAHRQGVMREEAPLDRGFVALACAFLVDWVLWLRVSGNGRYFLAMACVAGVLGVVLAFHVFAVRRRALGLLLVAVLSVQGVQLAIGTGYRTPVAWDGGPWFEVSVPVPLKNSPALYFVVGLNSESLIAPFLAEGSAFVNLSGDYVLGPGDANGARVLSMIRKYATHIRVITMADEFQRMPPHELPKLSHADGMLAYFGLRADTTDCSTMIVRDMRAPSKRVMLEPAAVGARASKSTLLSMPVSPDGYLVACHVVPDPVSRVALASAEREPNLVFDRMEDACPRLFQPARPITKVYRDGGGYVWVRTYESTNLDALISGGWLKLVDGTRGGAPDLLGGEKDWARAPLPLSCGRRGERYYARVVSSSR